MASTARQKRSYLHHQGEFQLQNCTVGTVHDSDHEGVVRIFVGHSYHSNELFILHYVALYFLYQECNDTTCTMAAIQIKGTARLYSARTCSNSQVPVCSNFQLEAVRTWQLGQLEHTCQKHLAGAFDLYGCHVVYHVI